MALDALKGAPRDFDFAVGDWRVEHRRLKDRLVGSDEWIEFDGRMSTQNVLGGFGNVEDNLLRLQKNGLGGLSAITQQFDWTDGCIALSNEDMQQVWELVQVPTPIEIAP